MRVAHALVGVALLIAVPAIARANGRYPSAQQLIIGPQGTESTFVLRTTFGLAVSLDSARTFHWTCEAAYGSTCSSVFDAPFALDPGAGAVIGLFDGVVHASADYCSYPLLASLAGDYVIDVDASADGQHIVLVTSSGTPGAHNGVMRSDDGGQTFAMLGAGLTGVLFETLEMAPTDLERVYLSAVSPDGTSHIVLLYRSDDGGATLTPLPYVPAPEAQTVYIAGVDPTNEDIVYARTALSATSDAGPVDDGTSLLQSTDGGMSWTEIASTAGDMLGFTIGQNGTTLWLGGADERDGLQRSDDRGTHWQRIGNPQVLCLYAHGAALYMCANNARDGFALGRSTDLGITFTPVLEFQNLEGPFACDADSPESGVCSMSWPATQAMIGGGATPDAGSVDAGTPQTSTSGCSCGVTPRRSEWGAVMTAVVALAAMRKRRAER